jgi:RNA polymerase sigma-70 factor (ECF subfamily)
MTDPADRHAADTALLQRMADGDVPAVGEFYDRYAGLLYGLILHVLHSQSDADHVLQEVFLYARDHVGSYRRHVGTPVAWLIGIARHHAVERLRTRPVHARAADGEAGGASQRGILPGRSAEQQAAAVALASLPAEQRQLIEQAFFLGFSQMDLAARHRLPLSIVRARILTGMVVLRKQLEYLCWGNER